MHGARMTIHDIPAVQSQGLHFRVVACEGGGYGGIKVASATTIRAKARS